MGKVSPSVLRGSNIGARLSDGRVLFSQLNFRMEAGRHAILGADLSVCTTFCRILAGDLFPSEGSITCQVDHRLFLASPAEGESERTIADELGHGAGVRALRKIRTGVVDPELFAIQAEDWDAEDSCLRALNEKGLDKYDLLEEMRHLSPDERALVQMAAIDLRRPDLLAWDQPTEQLSPAIRLAVLDSIENFNGTLVLSTRDQDLLREVSDIWRLAPEGLHHHHGNLDSYQDSLDSAMIAADEALMKAELELRQRRREADNAQERRRIQRDRAQQFADTGLPKLHRGNMKRKSQESMAKAKAHDSLKIKEAEALLRRARETRDQIAESFLLQ
jgi:ATPase subunit of ABC transporter with duplicated ATPase domains